MAKLKHFNAFYDKVVQAAIFNKPTSPDREILMQDVGEIFTSSFGIACAVFSVKKNERRARLNAYENRARFGSQQLKTQELSQIEIPYQCPYCENFSEVSNLELDHIHPTSWGGLSMRQNVILVCNECNRRKSNTPLRRFAINYNLNYEEICNRLEALGKFV